MWSSQPVQVTSAAVGDWTGWVEGYENTPEEPAEAPTMANGRRVLQVGRAQFPPPPAPSTIRPTPHPATSLPPAAIFGRMNENL
ncbi:hypothetical protein FIBSPDRAFT_870200 [Athelia psychrophila]|uniref:Uncharacterized protein n=1 Tax=Athelia psychrophila TaxID=1759441 RepID=A0A166B9R0_9AGAM|nr:hypothetical protein FIBSPDRAFT_870200 [Fibularhizoctonia sp. CBS 109695]